MSELFLMVLNMSFTASYVILFVMLIRLLLKKAPKIISYILWSVVGFRLMIPFTFESMFSLMPQNTHTGTIPNSIIYDYNPQINSGIQSIDSSINKILPVPTIGDSVNPLQIYLEIGTVVWLLGVILLVSYSILSILKLKKQLKGAQLTQQNIYEYAYFKTPFVLGVIRPKIYLPVHLDKEEREYILLHEQTHIKRKDHLIKMVGFFITSIHWFNPLVWASYRLMSLDMEYSCDEAVLKALGQATKKTYANSLLSLAKDRYILNGSPLAFGEGNVKRRIKNVLHYKKPEIWVIVSTVILVVGVSVGLVANPINSVKLFDVVAFPEEVLERSIYGTLIFENKVMDLNKVKIEEVIDYLRELKVNKSPISRSRDINRDHTNQISIVFKGLYNEDMGNIDVNFNNDFSIVWVDNDVKPSLSYSIKDPNDVRSFFERQLGSTGKLQELIDISLETTLYTKVEPTTPKLSLKQSLGVAMPELDYASDEVVIFHSYFGLFVYDLNKLQIIRSIDLKPLNCDQIQGSNYCEVSVSEDGNTVYLHPMESENMYIYKVTSNTLKEVPYEQMGNCFRGIPIEEIIDSTRLGMYSYTAAKFNADEYGYLYSSDFTLSTLSYVRGDSMYQIFEEKNN